MVFVIAALAGLAAGLVVWAPWRSPPLLRPAGLTAGTATVSTASFHWSRPATGPNPDRYVILRDGRVVGSVAGTVTSYQDTGLALVSSYQYRVAAERGRHRSVLSAPLEMKTVAPPVSQARLQDPWSVDVKIVRGLHGFVGVPKSWTESSWQANPKCTAGPCAVVLSGTIAGHPFAVTLARAGAVYTGQTRAKLFPCGSGSVSFPLRYTMKFRITVTSAQPENQVWAALAWAGTLTMSSPYTASSNYFCAPSNLRATLSASP